MRAVKATSALVTGASLLAFPPSSSLHENHLQFLGAKLTSVTRNVSSLGMCKVFYVEEVYVCLIHPSCCIDNKVF